MTRDGPVVGERGVGVEVVPRHGGLAPVAIRVGAGGVVAADGRLKVLGGSGLFRLLKVDAKPKVAAVKQIRCSEGNTVQSFHGGKGLFVNHFTGTVHENAVHVVNLAGVVFGHVKFADTYGDAVSTGIGEDFDVVEVVIG